MHRLAYAIAILCALGGALTLRDIREPETLARARLAACLAGPARHSCEFRQAIAWDRIGAAVGMGGAGLLFGLLGGVLAGQRRIEALLRDRGGDR